ncbi:MAG: hypothetical protein F4Z67_00260 [Synechococcus sp. SB0667_bin_8]|nr:hypothetical protein [Synechococcus sp. SB0667_bin_8]
MRAAIEQGSTLGEGYPTGITISRTQPVTPPAGTGINIQSQDSAARWMNTGESVAVPSWSAYYHGIKLRDYNSKIVSQTINVWTDIGGPTPKPFTEVYPLDTDISEDGTNDALQIDENNMGLMTHFARHPDDNRDGDDSPDARDRGVLGQNREFNTGHEIGSRFDGAYGVLTCVSQTCTINMDDHALTEMTGWAFVPKIVTDGQGGSRSPQVLVEDTDYRYFGYWLRGPDHANGGGYDIYTFAGGSEPYTGDTGSLTGRATYRGPAGGLYVKDADGGSSSTGQFTATVTLHADFGSKQTISGSMGDFRDGSRNLGWSLGMGSTSINASKFSGTTHGVTYTGQNPVGQGDVYTGSAGNIGSYDGTFYGSTEDNNYPYGVTGTFTGTFDDGAVIGGFGASQAAIHPNHP